MAPTQFDRTPVHPEPAGGNGAPPPSNIRELPASRLRPDLLFVGTWEDPVLERAGLDPRGSYAELFWLPVVGPSALWLLRRMNDGLDSDPQGYVLDPTEAAAELGVGGPGSRHEPLGRAVRRLERFGLVRLPASSTIEVRRKVGPVPRHRLERLPPGLQARHAKWEATRPDGGALRRRAREMAADLAGIGNGAADIERHLLAIGMHPALAYDAAVWATVRWGDPIAT